MGGRTQLEAFASTYQQQHKFKQTPFKRVEQQHPIEFQEIGTVFSENFCNDCSSLTVVEQVMILVVMDQCLEHRSHHRTVKNHHQPWTRTVMENEGRETDFR
ncbi:hypothetical protein QQP08_007376 [Theobroma cacao]|nr:hypothetical protein QQP08_007376 [Theobroma cacao]